MTSDFLLATELADYLVRKGLPFRKAHAIVGDIVRECIDRKLSLHMFPLADYQKKSRLFGKDVYSILTPRSSISRKRSSGSTSPAEIRKAIRTWQAKLR